MEQTELFAILQALDTYLTVSCDVVLVGGAAMILHFGAQRATHDIDALILRGDWNVLRQAVKAVAAEYGLAEDWLNDAVKGFADILPPDFYQRLTPLPFSCQHLRLYVLGRPEQTALKLVALREQDLEDLELLLPALSESDKTILLAIMQHVNTFRPDWALKMRYFLEEQGWQIV